MSWVYAIDSPRLTCSCEPYLGAFEIRDTDCAVHGTEEEDR